MCYDADAIPPIPHGPAVTAVRSAEPLTLTSADGTAFAAFLAEPARPTGPGVLILPDNRGLRGFYEHLARRLAEQGHPALAIDYFGRTAGPDLRTRGADFGDMPQHMRHLGGLTAAGLDADLTAGLDHLRAAYGRTVAALGFCFGGRQAFRAAAPKFGLSAAVGFYGYPDTVFGAPGPTQLAAELTTPLLAFWGGADPDIPATTVSAFDDALTAAGCAHEFVTYPGAPHGFFDGGTADFAEASADAWRRTLAFLAAHSGDPEPIVTV